jgi:hypothetical protein
MSSKIRAAIAESFGDDTILFDDCDAAIIGVSNGLNSTGQVIYDYDKLVKVFEKSGMSHEDAVEWVEYKVAGAGIKNGSIVMHSRKALTQ